jgi:putative addiction module component (TIGR02574 family)
MSKLAEVEELIRRLPAADRMRLLESTWVSLEASSEAQDVPDWHKVELDKRLAAHERDPGAARPWRAVMAELRSEFGKDA